MKALFYIKGVILAMVLMAGTLFIYHPYAAAGTEEARKQALFEAKCGPPCHSLELSLKREDTRAGWDIIVRSMKRLADNSDKIRINDSDIPHIVQYLADIAGPEMKKARLRNIRIFLAGCFALLIILGIVIYFRVKQVKQRQT
ncbi:MAG: hypothetical protein HY730_00745 [Candidatus Tectomicrobia bacterium]|uniref:Cytochrome c domain-containing protein n=1 Tax=Tectimicrobiota bacterium TaxID=2528274 RepID=A0A933GJB6_UNCTE|nr:hypothetical protein [Candidatus Tectomicrobia bacterium]